MLFRSVLILFPDGPPDTPVSDRRLAWYFAEELKGLSNPGRSGSEGAVIRYIMAGPQPHLTTLLSGMVLMVVGNKDCPPGLKDALKLLPVIKAVVRELCQLSPP